MRALFAASVLTTAFGQNATTLQGFTNAAIACMQPVSAALQNNQGCTTMGTAIASIFTSNNTDLGPFCGSPCFSMLRTAYAGVATCVLAYKPTLVAQLQAEGVANPQTLADSMMIAYTRTSTAFDFFCLKNEIGDYCFPMFWHMSLDAASAAANATSVIDTVCRYYYNSGCCLPSLDSLYGTIGTSSFSSSLTRICPALNGYAPPPCVPSGQRAVALSVSMSLTGLTCSAYLQQSASFKEQYEAALKLDLSSQGISPNFISVEPVTDVNGVCTVKLVLRAGSDADTNALKTAASTMNTAALTNSNQVLATASGTGSVSALGSPSVSTTYVLGQTNSNSGSMAVPSVALLAAFLMWMA